jgi:hypothetical protein
MADGVDPVLVSVVVPAYNAARTLDATLRSARGQTHERLEIIVVDDGSTDDTPAIAARHAAEDPRVRLLRKANGGSADARNHGMRASRGRFIAPLDSDDLWHPTKIAKQLAVFAAGDPSMTLVYTLSYLIDVEDRVFGAVGYPMSGEIFLRTLLMNFVGNGSPLLFRRDAIDAIGGYDASAAKAAGSGLAGGAEDPVVQSLLARLGPVGVVPEYLTGYRRMPGTLSTRLDRMARAQHWHIDSVRRAVPETPEAIVRDAHVGIDARVAVASVLQGRAAEGLSLAARAIRRSPVFAIEMLAAYLAKPVRRRLRRADPALRARPRFLEADPRAGGSLVDPLPAARRLRRLEAADRAFAATRGAPLRGVVPLGLAPGP